MSVHLNRLKCCTLRIFTKVKDDFQAISGQLREQNLKGTQSLALHLSPVMTGLVVLHIFVKTLDK